MSRKCRRDMSDAGEIPTAAAAAERRQATRQPTGPPPASDGRRGRSRPGLSARRHGDPISRLRGRHRRTHLRAVDARDQGAPPPPPAPALDGLGARHAARRLPGSRPKEAVAVRKSEKGSPGGWVALRAAGRRDRGTSCTPSTRVTEGAFPSQDGTRAQICGCPQGASRRQPATRRDPDRVACSRVRSAAPPRHPAALRIDRDRRDEKEPRSADRASAEKVNQPDSGPGGPYSRRPAFQNPSGQVMATPGEE